MFCKSYTRAGSHSNGKPLIVADLITKTKPVNMPTDTSEIDNVSKDCMLAPGSTLMVTSPSLEVHIMNDEYEWDKI